MPPGADPFFYSLGQALFQLLSLPFALVGAFESAFRRLRCERRYPV
jgi:hypothetical protein